MMITFVFHNCFLWRQDKHYHSQWIEEKMEAKMRSAVSLRHWVWREWGWSYNLVCCHYHRCQATQPLWWAPLGCGDHQVYPLSEQKIPLCSWWSLRMAENNSTCRQAGRDCPGSTGLNGNAHGPRLGTAPTQVCVCVCVSCSVVSDSLRLHGLQPTRLFCPQNSPGKNTGMGCHALLQRFFPTQVGTANDNAGVWRETSPVCLPPQGLPCSLHLQEANGIPVFRIGQGLEGALLAQLVKNLPAMQETRVWFLGREGPLEKEMATHSSILAWRIPWTEEPDGLQCMGL